MLYVNRPNIMSVYGLYNTRDIITSYSQDDIDERYNSFHYVADKFRKVPISSWDSADDSYISRFNMLKKPSMTKEYRNSSRRNASRRNKRRFISDYSMSIANGRSIFYNNIIETLNTRYNKQ